MSEIESVQAAPAVLMIRPSGFGFNEETARTNRFQTRPGTASADAVRGRAVREFDALVGALRGAGVEVVLFEDPPEPPTPDAIFPNNWVSFHSDGTVVLYPMCAASRRLERREDVVRVLTTRYGFHVERVVDLTEHEKAGRFLEGTGSLVFDHRDRCGYASLSHRTDPSLVEELVALLGYQCQLFRATDEGEHAVYHTNVVMSIGTGFVVIASESISDRERLAVMHRLRTTGRRIIEIGRSQMRQFAANILEVKAAGGKRIVVMSEAARAALGPCEEEILETGAGIVASSLDTIESVGGGSARCMLAELFLPREHQRQSS